MATAKPKSKKAEHPRTGAKRPKSAPSKRSAAARPPRKKRAAKKEASPKDSCFVISPFGGWHDDYYSEIFCPAIRKAGLKPSRADDLFRSSNIVHDIWHLVVSSRVLLADLTGKNPNVFYELGLAHAARKPVLLLTQSMEDVPFDLRGLRIITYEVEHPKWGEVLREKIEQGLSETLESPERSVLPTFLEEEPKDTPVVTADEARLIDLQQQVDSLRAETRATGGGPDIRAPEARRLIADMLEEGLSRGVIVRRVSRLGAPEHWVQRQIDRNRERNPKAE
jgi:hypothetical protein